KVDNYYYSIISAKEYNIKNYRIYRAIKLKVIITRNEEAKFNKRVYEGRYTILEYLLELLL
ncbi:hypothetical protein COCHEDRAFT_1122371, partial [Bipolaris maydis C5]